MMKILNLPLVFMMGVFYLGCSDQDDCTSKLSGKVAEVYTPKTAANTMAMFYDTLELNDLTLEYLEQNRKAYSIKKGPNKITSYTENYEVAYNYSMSDYNISFLNYTNTLNIDITTISSLSEDENSTYSSNSMDGNMSVLDTTTLEVTKVEYDMYTKTYKKDENESAKYYISSVLSYSNSFNKCADGIYQIETKDRLTKSQSGTFSDGTLNINGTLFKFNDGGVADVYFDDGSVAYGVMAKESLCE